MITQFPHFVVDCPVCSRPVELHSQYIGHELVCGHCRGGFIAYGNDDDDELTATKLDSAYSTERAGQLLRCTDKSAPDSSSCDTRLACVSAVRANSKNGLRVAPSAEEYPDRQHPSKALVVEFRDEVFARVKSDMAQAGIRIIRANSATEALQLYGIYKPSLVLVNVDQLDQSGWLLAAKLKFVDSRIRAWLYQPQSSACEVRMAKFLEIDELVDYRGNLFRLSDTIVRLLDDFREPISATATEELSIA